MKLFKICFTMKPIDSSFGGGNQFLNNFCSHLNNNKSFIDIVFDLNDDDIDIIFIMDPRKLTLNKITSEMIKKYKSKHKHVAVIHRVNDSDKPRNQTNVLDPIMLDTINNIDDVVVYVSEFTKKYYEQQNKLINENLINNEIIKKVNYVILNGCNTSHFYPNNIESENTNDNNKIIRICTHHWSNNYNKGFEYYNALDNYVGNNSKYEFVFIGRNWNEGYVPKNTKIIGPYYGKELGDVLRTFDIYITGAQFENCPMHVCEALACGLPILYHKNLGGGIELCKKAGEMYDNTKTMIKKLEIMSSNLAKYKNKIKYENLDSNKCNLTYENVLYSTLLKYKFKIKDVKNKPLWLKKVLLWLVKIEKNDYPWSLNGTDNNKLGSVSLFAKLATIFKNYYVFNKKNMYETLMKYHDGNTFVDIAKEKIAETRQALSAIINLGLEIPKIDVDGHFKEPLFFMNDKAWTNPWGAGAQLSHYLFFMKMFNKDDKINKVLNDFNKYKKKNGWYFGNPPKTHIINGIMKIFTGFDIINYNMDKKTAIDIINFLMDISSESIKGGCGLYDYVYVLTKCMDYCDDNVMLEACKERLHNMLNIILNHQMTDGGFKYDNSNETAHKYYGHDITPDGFIGNIHSTTLFCMAIARLDKYLNLGLNLNIPIS